MFQSRTYLQTISKFMHQMEEDVHLLLFKGLQFSDADPCVVRNTPKYVDESTSALGAIRNMTMKGSNEQTAKQCQQNNTDNTTDAYTEHTNAIKQEPCRTTMHQSRNIRSKRQRIFDFHKSQFQTTLDTQCIRTPKIIKIKHRSTRISQG